MRLADLQRAFQARVLTHEHEQGIEAALTGAGDDDFADRLGAYVGGYRARLVEALGVTYPVVQATLGADGFGEQMRAYIDANPSRHYSVRYYGAGVAQWLAAHVPGPVATVLGELARWEWLLAEVFDAPDDTPLGVETLGAVPAQSWPGVSFRWRASVRRYSTATNAVDYWRAANGLCETPGAPVAAERSEWLLWRHGLKTLFRSLSPLEALALDDALGGATFGQVCAHLAGRMDDSEVALAAATWLRGWIAEELIASHQLPDEVT